MSDVTITVRGESETRVSPERATVHLSVRSDGADRQRVIEHTLGLAEPLRAGLVDRADTDVLVEWSSTRLTVRSERPWNESGKRLALVHHAAVDFTATFADVSELSLWASEVSAWEGVEIGHVDWHLTPSTRARVEREVATTAVGVAVSRAEAYAAALGLTTVSPVEIADVGLISRGESTSAPVMMKARGAAFMAADGAPAMTYEPDEIIIGAAVEGRFLAR